MQPAAAQGTHLWTQSQLEEFEKGTPQGVALTSDGHLREGPGLTELLTTPSTFVWSVAVDKNGAAYWELARRPPCCASGKDGKPFTLFETKDLSVQVVRLGPDGALYAATLPSGKVYKLNADATAKQDETTRQSSSMPPSWTIGSRGRQSRSPTSRAQIRITSGTWPSIRRDGSTSPPAGREPSIVSIPPSPARSRSFSSRATRPTSAALAWDAKAT